MFPIDDTVKTKSFPIATLILIGINIYVFVRYLLLGDIDAFVAQYALIPSQIDFSNISSLYPFITSQFLHGGILHIASNMLFLWVFGDNVEEKFGSFFFILFYLSAGALGAFVQYILNTGSDIPMIGASGAVSGVLGAYLVFFPHHKIKSIVLLFFVITVISIPARIYLFYWFFIQLFQGVTSLPNMQFETGGVAFFAHIGGFAYGYAIAKLLNRPKKEYIEGEIIEED